MKIKHHLEIESDNPFLNCKLDRKKYASVLTSIIATYADGFVLALNNEWRTGKTTFVTMWKHQLESEGYRTLLFNAWETDFEENPLIALIAEFKALANQGDEAKFKSLISKASVFAKNIAPALIKGVAERYGVSNVITTALEKTTESATEILKDEIDDYAKKKEGIVKFRESLHEFVRSVDSKKPIVFIIDELDRCRPNYAVALLEQVKHLFSVSGIVFVLSIDKKQLGNAVRGVYGSDRINADEYLRRFIDLEYSIPAPDTKGFVQYLYEYFKFGEILASEQRKRYEFGRDADEFITIAIFLFDSGSVTLRQQEKIFAHARIALLSLRANQYLFPTLFIFLIYLRSCHLDIYEKIQQRKYSAQKLLDTIGELLPLQVDSETKYYLEHLEALLAFMYNNYYDERNSYKSLLEKNDSTEEETLHVKPKFDRSANSSAFIKHIKGFRSKYDWRDINIKIVMDKIDLVQAVVV